MADVKDLEAIDFSAPVFPSESKVSKADAEAVSDIVKTVSDLKKNKVLRKARQDIDIAIEDVAADEDDVEVLPFPEKPADPKDYQADIARDTLRKLDTAIKQGKTSQANLARLKARQVLADAQLKYPSLRAELAREFSSVLETDPELFAMGITDQRASRVSQEAIKDLDRIKEEAYGDVSEGGLGMDAFQIPIDHPAFVPVYLEKQALRQQIEDSALILAARKANRELDADDYLQTYAQGLYGETSALNAIMRDATRDLKEAQKAMANVGLTPNAQNVLDWNSFGRTEYIERLDNVEILLQQNFAEIPTRLIGTDRYAQMKAMTDDQIAYVGRLREAIEADNVDLVKAWQAEDTLRNIQFRDMFPEAAKLNRFVTNMQLVLENAETLGAEDIIQQHRMGGFMQQNLDGVMTRLFVLGGQDQLPDDATPEQILNTLNRNRDYSSKPYLHAATDDEHTLKSIDAIWDADMQGGLEVLTKHSAPDFIAGTFRVGVSTMQDVINIGRPPESLYNKILDTVASGNMLPAASRARDGTIRDRNSIIAFGNVFEKFWDSRVGGDSGRRKEYIKSQNREVARGISLGDVTTFDGTQVKENGRIQLTIDREELKRLMFELQSEGRKKMGMQPLPQDVKEALTKAEEQARALSQTMSRDLRAFAHMQMFRQELDTPDYGRSFEETQFPAFFPEFEEVEIERGNVSP